MVHPIASGSAAAPYGAPSAEFERPPVTLPEPAVQVTPSQEARGSQSATTAPGGQDTKTQDGGMDSMNSLDKALELVNNNMKAWATGMRFDMDPEAQRVVVSIIDSESGEVLRTVPTDAVIRVAKMIVQLQGRSIDTRV